MFKLDKSLIRLAMRTTAISAAQTTKFAVPIGAFQLSRRQVHFPTFLTLHNHWLLFRQYPLS